MSFIQLREGSALSEKLIEKHGKGVDVNLAGVLLVAGEEKNLWCLETLRTFKTLKEGGGGSGERERERGRERGRSIWKHAMTAN